MREHPTGTITLLFTDIEGSMRLLQQLGEGYASLLETCQSILRAAFLEFHGHEIETYEEGFFMAFARTTDAVAAAVAAQLALFTHAWPEGVTVRVRMGLHTYEPSVRTEGYVGSDVDYATSIMSAGHGGQVLLSQTTRDLVEHALPEGVSVVDLGAYRLKELQRPDHLYQLIIADLPNDFPPPRTLDTRLNNLPPQPTPLIGREHEVATVTALLRREDVRLVTLTGPGGSGKTRLSLRVAEEQSEVFSDGVYFVNLAPIRDSEFVVPAIAQTLDIQEMEGQPLFALLKAFLREKHLLFLLDNFEQVVHAAPQIAELLAACPRLKILVTSRMALHVRAEHVFPVPPLALPDSKDVPDVATLSQYGAVALFLQQAQAVKPDFHLTQANARAVPQICARLDGLPLAIELAAVRINLFPPHVLLARLSRRLAVLTSGPQDAPARQQTLRDTIAWSYRLLNPQERRLFRWLSVFAGGCTLEAAEAVYAIPDSGGEQVVDVVASLIDKNLVQQSGQESDELRLVMLETIREYGLEALAESREMEAVQHAHALYYLALAEQAEPELAGLQQAAWLERLEREHDNLRVALSWALEQGPGEEADPRREVGLRLAVSLRQFWVSHAYLQEGQSFLERAAAASTGAAPLLRAKVLIAAADLAVEQSDSQWGQQLAEEGLRLCQELGDREGVACCLYQMGWFSIRRREYALARSLLDECVAFFKEPGNKNRLGWSLYALGWLEYNQSEHIRAHTYFKEALALFREIGNAEGIAFMLVLAADVTRYIPTGDMVTARSMSDEGLMLAREMINKSILGFSLLINAEIALGQDEVDTAYARTQECLALYRELEIKGGLTDALTLFGRVEARLRNYAATQNLYQEALAITRERNFRSDFPSCLKELAVVVAAQGEEVWAARLLGAAEALSAYLQEVINYPLTVAPVYDRAAAVARTQLGEEAFARAWAEGRTMPLESVIGPEGRAATSRAKLSPRYPAGLTTREVEVLRLVAQGLTDIHVAERLVISPRTVNTHLTSIYNKLGVDSRAAATRFAVEHQLV